MGGTGGSVEKSADMFRWGDGLAQAAEELAGADWLLQGGHGSVGCFRSQQVAEKAFQAILDDHGQVPFGHALAHLVA